jgi:hypothetical protein
LELAFITGHKQVGTARFGSGNMEDIESATKKFLGVKTGEMGAALPDELPIQHFDAKDSVANISVHSLECQLSGIKRDSPPANRRMDGVPKFGFLKVIQRDRRGFICMMLHKNAARFANIQFDERPSVKINLGHRKALSPVRRKEPLPEKFGWY